MMDIEVDPKLFVTCRLCVSELGQFQIIPSVQEKIKYCFDICVEPFDGLPQLICATCKNILSNFHSIKQSFCEKQDNLKLRVLKKEDQENDQELSLSIATKQNTASLPPRQNNANLSPQLSDSSLKTKKNKSKKTKKLNYSSSSEDDSLISQIRHKSSKKNNIDHTSSTEWKANYKKQLVCKICNGCWSTKSSLMNHIRSHSVYKSYNFIYKKDCLVKLRKTDNQPNLTGQRNKVVHDANKIVERGGPYYYIVYTKNPENIFQIEHDDSTTHSTSYLKSVQSSSDDDVQPVKSRKRRFLSRSSNDTVVIESKSNKTEANVESTDQNESTQHDNTQCISIDSSDNDDENSNVDLNSSTKQTEAKLNDYKLIQGIITMCVKFHQEKNDLSESHIQSKKTEKLQVSTESQLKHKLLSIGRKIINKQGFNCTGLLRYMEHKNLEIIWMTKPDLQANKENNYIRILPKLRGNNTTDDSKSWVFVNEVPTLAKKAVTKPVNNAPENIELNQEMQVDEEPNIEVDADSAVLYFTGNNLDSKNKLLNANPVANPKQLPKKLTLNKGMVQDNMEDNLCMPIITSTTSLANINNEETVDQGDQVPVEINTNSEPQVPRIKVKPASELMSDNALYRLMTGERPTGATTTHREQVQNAWPVQNTVRVYVTVPPAVPAHSGPAVRNLTSPYQVVPSTPIARSSNEPIILHTVELPNTRTNTPFRYIKNLLQIHNLVFKSRVESLSRDYVCLAKFKVSFHQSQPVCNEPVVLCLTLFCLKNTFCINVRNKNQDIIDIDQLSANWQWEIIQTYRKEDVVEQVLKNAKKVCQETHSYAYTMLCLLKSINKVN